MHVDRWTSLAAGLFLELAAGTLFRRGPKERLRGVADGLGSAGRQAGGGLGAAERAAAGSLAPITLVPREAVLVEQIAAALGAELAFGERDHRRQADGAHRRARGLALAHRSGRSRDARCCAARIRGVER